MRGVEYAMVHYFTVKNGIELKEKIDELARQGVSKDEIVLFSHQKERAKELADTLNIVKMGPSENGYIKSFRNIFLSREDELKKQLHTFDLEDSVIDHLYHELMHDALIIIVKNADE